MINRRSIMKALAATVSLVATGIQKVWPSPAHPTITHTGLPDITDEECLRRAREIYPIRLGSIATSYQVAVFKHIGVFPNGSSKDANDILKAYIDAYGDPHAQH